MKRPMLLMMMAVLVVPVFTWAWATEQVGEPAPDHERIWLHVALHPVDNADLDDAAEPVATVKALVRLGEPLDMTATVAGKTVLVRSILSATQNGAIRGPMELQAAEPFELSGVVITTVISQVRTHIRLEMDKPVDLAATNGGGGWKWIVQVNRPSEGTGS